MFNLESSISTWRHQMLAVRIPHDTLAELESHLHENLAQQIRSGLSEQDAFNQCVQHIGSPRQLQSEFKKMKTNTLLAYWPHALLLLVAAFFVALNIWVGEGLNVFAPVYCLLLSLNLPLMSGPGPADPRTLRPRFQLMLTGQILLGLGAAAVYLAPLHPAIGLTLAILSCVWFSIRLRKLSHAGILAS